MKRTRSGYEVRFRYPDRAPVIDAEGRRWRRVDRREVEPPQFLDLKKAKDYAYEMAKASQERVRLEVVEMRTGLWKVLEEGDGQGHVKETPRV